MSAGKSQINIPMLMFAEELEEGPTQMVTDRCHMTTLSLLQDFMEQITHDITLSAFAKEKKSRQPCMTCGAVHNSRNGTGTNYVSRPGQDIYGRAKLQAADSALYFECLNCTRKIAASRYAAHLERCLGGRGSRGRAAASILSSALPAVSPMSMSPSTPYGTDDEPPTKQITKKRRVQNGIAKAASIRQPSPATTTTSNSSGDMDGSEGQGHRNGHMTDRTHLGNHNHSKSKVSKVSNKKSSPVLSDFSDNTGIYDDDDEDGTVKSELVE
ncbi:hypothetical protein V1511DRAFT_489303 [Dipodascopsis uninucleata]